MCVIGPAVAAVAGVALVGANAAVLAADAGADTRLLQVEVVDGVLDLVDVLGHGLCGVGGSRGKLGSKFLRLLSTESTQGSQ